MSGLSNVPGSRPSALLLFCSVRWVLEYLVRELFWQVLCWSFFATGLICTDGNASSVFPTLSGWPQRTPGLPWWLKSKESACSAGDPGSVSGSGRSLEKDMATHSSTLAWRAPMDRAGMASFYAVWAENSPLTCGDRAHRLLSAHLPSVSCPSVRHCSSLVLCSRDKQRAGGPGQFPQGLHTFEIYSSSQVRHVGKKRNGGATGVCV